MTICAIYVRKSSEENLERNLNDPNVQRSVCEKYVKDKGWELAPKKYDDTGYPGDTLERPALKELLQDVENGKIDCVVVCRVECLSNSSNDFLKIKDLCFDEHQVKLISVRQDLDYTDHHGEFVLRTFIACAQFERESEVRLMEDKAAYDRSIKTGTSVSWKGELSFTVTYEKHNAGWWWSWKCSALFHRQRIY